jgi:hypothetical protein
MEVGGVFGELDHIGLLILSRPSAIASLLFVPEIVFEALAHFLLPLGLFYPAWF